MITAMGVLRKVVRVINNSFKMVLLALLALLIFDSVILGLWVGYNLLTPMKLPSEGTTFRIASGAGLSNVTTDLTAEGMLLSSRWLTWYGRLTEGEGTIKAGEYYLPNDLTPLQFLHKVRKGEVIQHQVTFLEGWSFQQLLDTLHNQAGIDHQLDGASSAEIMTRLQVPGENPEGRFFPDTYNYQSGTSDIAILVTAYKRMQKILAEEWLLRAEDLPLKTPYEALILASIVEKESGLQTDRSRIAAVFVRRLAQRIRLQSDPTVIYGLGSEFDGDLRRADLSRNTPYNTYVHYGLTPTPISNPSRAAIHASLHPANISSLYFVARGDGTSYFSDTLAEHNRAVRKYQIDAARNTAGEQKKLNREEEPVIE